MMIFNIQRYSTHDGPGIRTVIFFKGCSLACRWCQNPESLARAPELLYDARSCLAACTQCQTAAPNVAVREGRGIRLLRAHADARAIAALRDCCPSQALTVCGEEMSVAAILQQIERDRPFYQRSGGGITLSGGEPFMQPHLAETLLRRCQQAGIHTAVETCLHVPWRYVAPALPWTDLFLADLKQVDRERFRTWTGGSVGRVMDNLRRLSARGKALILRVPLIPGFNTDLNDIQRIIDFAASELATSTIHFLPYHTLGRNKYRLLDRPYLAPEQAFNDPALLDAACAYASQCGLSATLGG
ncbi:4-hydroxyphenylacetate decarboxylase activating enzyme [Edwardsiella hoshinae]|uniref:4-hydroxyphenylacetate decarboxylase activating enzyme n=2 Tax=Edwardsiella hoshinae TaxID=93378 RepID=A0A376DMV1_9GAMM|nr:4-hydroxyphenylacetate decarboxylase activating enzyme [Edwardsiella hoshinae]